MSKRINKIFAPGNGAIEINPKGDYTELEVTHDEPSFAKYSLQ